MFWLVEQILDFVGGHSADGPRCQAGQRPVLPAGLVYAETGWLGPTGAVSWRRCRALTSGLRHDDRQRPGRRSPRQPGSGPELAGQRHRGRVPRPVDRLPRC